MELNAPHDLPTLVARAQSGDETAYGAIFERFGDPVYRYLAVRCGDAHLAEELTGELWVRVVEHLPAFRFRHPPSEAAFAAWLYRIAKNLLHDKYRRSAREPGPLTEMMPSSERPLDDQVIAREAHQRLHAAIAQLTPEQREVVLFRFMEERHIADVALLMERSQGAVKTLQYRALHALAGLLGGQRRQQKG